MLIVRTVTDDDVGGSHLLPRQSGTVHGFSREFHEILFLMYDLVRSYEHDREHMPPRHVKAFLNPYNRMGDYIYHLAHYMFATGGRYDNVD